MRPVSFPKKLSLRISPRSLVSFPISLNGCFRFRFMWDWIRKWTWTWEKNPDAKFSVNQPSPKSMKMTTVQVDKSSYFSWMPFAVSTSRNHLIFSCLAQCSMCVKVMVMVVSFVWLFLRIDWYRVNRAVGFQFMAPIYYSLYNADARLASDELPLCCVARY